jgi:hypothetical protein
MQARVDNRAVQVSDSTTCGGAPAARPDELGATGGNLGHRGAGPSKRFRDAFKHAAEREAACEAAAAGVVGPGWFKPEPIRVGPPASKIAPAAATKIDRLLIGGAGGEAEARIRIGTGALAGAEIRLTTAAGSQTVTAQLLTPTAGSRQTLSVAMEEIRLRLRDKGIALASSVSRSRPNSDDRGETRRDAPSDGESGARAGAGSGDGWRAGR